jgi:hypothetical protein
VIGLKNYGTNPNAQIGQNINQYKNLSDKLTAKLSFPIFLQSFTQIR